MVAKWVYRFLIPGALGIGALATVIILPSAIEKSRHKGKKENIDIEMDVVDWNSERDFDIKSYDPLHQIKFWYGINKIPKMVDYHVDSYWHIKDTDAYTLGDLLDEINSRKPKTFRYNIDNKTLAGPMGRMLYGVKKSDDIIQKNNLDSHNLYWGIHQKQNSLGNWITASDDNYSYLSIRSSNSEYARANSHKYFDLNESFYAYDDRSSKGIDQIYLSSNNKFNLTTWKMV